MKQTYSHLPYLAKHLRAVPRAFAACILAITLVSCVHARSHRMPERGNAVNSVQAILADLAANDAALETVRARGKAIVKPPRQDAIQVLPQSEIAFARPDRLHLIGKKYGGLPVFELVCDSRRALFIARTDKSFQDISVDEAREADMVTPLEIARELFFPEHWEQLSPRRLQLVELTETPGEKSAVLEVYQDQTLRVLHRRLQVTLSADTANRWALATNALFDPADQSIVATTTYAKPVLENGFVFPRKVRAEFPEAGAFIDFTAATVKVNEPTDGVEYPDPETRARKLLAEGYDRVEATQE